MDGPTERNGLTEPTGRCEYMQHRGKGVGKRRGCVAPTECWVSRA